MRGSGATFCWALLVALAMSCTDEVSGPVLFYESVPAPRAALIEVGIDAPAGVEGLRALAQDLERIESLPFDGLMVDLGMSSVVFQSEPLVQGDYTAQVQALREVPFRRLTHNFTMLLVPAAEVDWFDDAAFSAMAENVRMAAELTQEAGLRGWLLDFVDGPALWNIQNLSSGSSFEEYQAIVSRRGEELMSAALAGYPSITLIAIAAYSDVLRSVCISGTAFAEDQYALLPAFLDGMNRARGSGPALLIDGFMGAYAAEDPRAYARFADLIRGDIAALEAEWIAGIATHRYPPTRLERWPASFELTCDEATLAQLKRDLPTSFGVMLDYPVPGDDAPFHLTPASFSRNHWTPAELRAALDAAQTAAERYVWLHNESVDFWGTKPSLPEPPEAYVQAIRDSRGPSRTGP